MLGTTKQSFQKKAEIFFYLCSGFFNKLLKLSKLHLMKQLTPLLFILIFFSCQPRDVNDPPAQAQGYAPVYALRQTVNTIAVESAKPTTRPGKIYAYGNYLFQVEQNEGIHIINNTNPQQAQKVAFLKVPMASEIAIKSGYLYTNNLNDLVVFDLNNVVAPQLVHRLENAFPVIDQTYPPVSGVFFECADPSKGVVIGWDFKMLNNPKCRR